MSLQHSTSARREGINDPGKLDRRITVQKQIYTRDGSGGAVLDWYDVATVWASLNFLHGGRLYAAQEKSFESISLYRIRYNSEVETGMRIIHGDDVLEIIGVDPLGRRHFLDLTCRATKQPTGDNRSDLDLGDGVTLLDLGDGETNLTRGGAIAA